MKEHRDTGSARGTVRKYGYLTQRLVSYSDNLGLVYVSDWNHPSMVRDFRSSWGVSPVTASKHLGIYKAFFEFCVENEWIPKNPARIRNPRNRTLRTGSQAADAGGKISTGKQKLPFSNEELNRMYEGCKTYGRTEIREWPKKRDGRQVVAITEYRDYHRIWTGEDLADFIAISVHTGLRISTIATFHISRMNAKGEIGIRAGKNGAWISTWVPEWLQQRMRTRGERIGPFIFGTHRTTDMNVITDVWRRKKTLWKNNGPWEEKPTPHRFRHTFVRILLERNVPVALVAELAGDTEKVIRKYYSGWIRERQGMVTQTLQQAFQDTPRPFAV
jgi:integrase